MTEPLVEKYRPETFSELQGHNKHLKEIKNWIENFEPGDKPILLHGPAGTGKTATAEVCANHIDAGYLEVNASSARKSDDLKQIAGDIQTETDQVVCLDEIDSLSYSANLTPLTKALEDPASPVVICCNDEWKVPNSITNKCNSYEFTLGKNSKKAKIREIAKKEGIDIDAQNIGKLATRDDLRSALNDLQQHARDGDVGWDDRDMEIGEFDSVENLIQGKKFVGSNVSPPDLLDYLDANLSKEFKGVEASLAHDALSRADKWLGRVDTTQDYSWWKYAGELQEQVANIRRSEPYDGYIRWEYPDWRRHSVPRSDGDSPEAQLYQALKRQDERMFSFAGNFLEFRKMMLPLIEDLPEEDRKQLALNYSVPDGALSALGLEKDEFESWESESTETDDEDEDMDGDGLGVLDF